MKYELLNNCSFEQDIYDTSMEHDGISTKPYPKKLIAYIRGDYDYKWWTGFFCIHNDMKTQETDREGDDLLEYLITEKFPNGGTSVPTFIISREVIFPCAIRKTS